MQELTDKLYNEGLSKGKAEGEALLAKAKEKAASIIDEAQKEAEAIVAKARKDAGEMTVKVSNDIKKAADQSIQATKNDIENLIISKAVDSKVDGALASGDYVKDILTAVAKNFNSEDASELSVVLPESLKSSLEPFVRNELSSIVGKGVEASFSKKISGGFRIGPKDGGYFISMTDETVKELISEYLRPATRKILFGE